MHYKGFTLLEMVVVLSILGLATAIAAPAMLRGIETWQRRGEVDAVLDQIRGLPATARAQGRDLLISDETLAAPDAPLKASPGWTVTTTEPWRVHHNGVCGGGVVQLEMDGRATTIEASAPFCDPRIRTQ